MCCPNCGRPLVCLCFPSAWLSFHPLCIQRKERVLIEAIIVFAVGLLTIASARIIRGQRWLYSLGLLTLPSLYAFFALRAGEQAVGAKEMIYGVPFIVAGLV